ncbi:hypothetical protein P389DRAFT_194371 [Cystobasidium minutum MCA 4210]|uniref:uncharacterized protein n=1 Tax=Cystobasidium minutum MCA 4210 TaxID=1397322 RepID=UPI0034CD93D8|eukprot:jgi/Rhomi1/194371/gm1.2585_g
MVGPALASSFRQQAANNNNSDNSKPGGGGYGGYGSYSNVNNNDEYSSNRGAYGGGGRRPSEDGGQLRYNNNNNDNNNYEGMLSNGPGPSASSSSSYATNAARQNHNQYQSMQNSRQQQQQQQYQHDDMGNSNPSYSNGSTLPSMASTGGGGPSSLSSSVPPPPPQAQSTATSKQPAIGSPEEIENSRRTARIHFEEFRAYLDAEGQRDPNARANAREKLTRLTRPQFQELSTDVYDELMRRQRAEGNALSGGAPEFLPQKPDFHPKRNQARQKLSTLPKTRFRDLASDVYFELERRYPEFSEASGCNEQQFSGGRPSEDTSGGRNAYPGGGSGSNQVQIPGRSSSRDDGALNGPRLQSSTSQKRPQFPQGKPSMDYQSSSSSTMVPTASSSGGPPPPSTAANEVIIPNKSKVIEEDISLPASTAMPGASMSSSSAQQGQPQQQQQRGYGAYANQNGYSNQMGRKSSSDRERPTMNGANNSQDSLSSEHRRDSPSPNLNNSGNSNSGPNDAGAPVPRKSNETPRLTGSNGPLLPTSPDWNNSLARASEASSLGTRLIGGYGGSTPSESGVGGGGRDWESDELEKVKSDYEYKIATMQNRMAGLEKDLRDAQDFKAKIEQETDERVNQLENELEKMKMRNEDAQHSIEQLEQELSEAQEQARSMPAPLEDNSASKDEEHQAELSKLEREIDSFRSKYNNEKDATENLKNEIEGLVFTLKEMNVRQDDLVNDREADLEKIRSLEEEVKEWKARYEQAKTELRELKATSQLFVRPTKADDDFMPTSPGGAIMDSHVTRFQSSIDDLLIAGRSDAPSSVIIATKQVINAVARIDEDVQEYESAGMADQLSPDDRERLHALKSKCNATLSNLTTAARNHATGHGLSPVSLLDAAASHLSNTIIELVRLLLMRKAGTPLLVGSETHSSTMKPSVSSTSISSRLGNPSQQSSSSTAQQQQSRNFPTRLASLKREDEAASGYGGAGGSQNAQGSSGRSSPASFRSRTVTASDRTHATSPEPQMRNDNSFNGVNNTSNSSFGDARSAKMNASTSETSLASNFNPDPRRNALQHQQQLQYQHQERENQNSRQDQYHHNANQSQGSMRSQTSNQSYQHEQDERRESDLDRRDQNDHRGDEDVTEKQDMNGDAEDWADLKNYLESQTEAIVHSITALLAAIRGGAQPMKLQENLSQIITIVSSIVQILQDNLPSDLHEESKSTIQELSANCDKLIELQNSAESTGPGGTQTFSKQTKQAMATASFGVAKSLKSINSLLASV